MGSPLDLGEWIDAYEPIFNTWIAKQFVSLQDWRDECYTMGRSKKAEEHFGASGSFGPLPRLAAGATLPLLSQSPDWIKTTKLRRAGGMVPVSQDARDTIQYKEIISEFESMGDSMILRILIDAASPFNNATSGADDMLGGDGVPLASAAHPTRRLIGGVAAQSNITGLPYSLANFETAAVNLTNHRSDTGDLMGLNPDGIITNRTLGYTILRDFISPEDPTTANRARNPVFDGATQKWVGGYNNRKIEITIIPQITSTTYWAVVDRRYMKSCLKWLTVHEPEIKRDYDLRSLDYLFGVYTTWHQGWTNWRWYEHGNT